MKRSIKMLGCVLGLLAPTLPAWSEDIDLFANNLSAAARTAPSVLFVLDNTSNWARANQQWPERDGESEVQGQAEVAAIKAALQAVGSDIRVGLMEFVTDGNANDNGGYVRFDMQLISTDPSGSVAAQNAADELFATLDTIYDDINTPDEKRNSNESYGSLIHDVYNYLAGRRQSDSGDGTPSTLADNDAYRDGYEYDDFERFSSPLTEDNACSPVYVIFISNPNASGPATDDADNSSSLTELFSGVDASPPASLAGGAGDGILMQAFSEDAGSGSGSYGYTYQCYESESDCDYVINGAWTNNDSSDADYETSDIAANCAIGGTCECSSNSSTYREGISTGPNKEQCPTIQGACTKYAGNGSCTSYEEIDTYSFLVEDTASSGGSLTATGNFTEPGLDYNLDDWTYFLHNYGIPKRFGEDSPTVRIPVTTYTLDVFNAAPNTEHAALMDSAARQGGGRRLEATSYAALTGVITQVLDDILAVNTSFAAVTLPLSATNRAQQENKVFVGMFRPSTQRKPRWFGNLKQYQLAKFDGELQLADARLYRAINSETGFASSCAVSFWTTDTNEVEKDAGGTTGPYFEGLGIDPPPVGDCSRASLTDGGDLSDLPDGPHVEKGGVAQQLRALASRSLYQVSTTSGGSRTALSEPSAPSSDAARYDQYLFGGNSGLVGGNCVDNSSGTCDTDGDAATDEIAEIMPYTGRRPTIHGDVVHSRPITITYGTTTVNSQAVSNFRVFYGANDGLFRQVNPLTGTEEWALIAEEHADLIERQYRNTPTIAFEGLPDALSADINAEAKDYFFDGSAAAFTEYNGSDLETAYLFLTMRRGGGTLYALDVSPASAGGNPPAAPTIMWAKTYSNVSELWSTPVAGLISTYENGATPVIAMGGGWDSCLDNKGSYSSALSGCSDGKKILIIDATDGTLIKSFATSAPVVGEVTPLDFDADGDWDFLYALDASGSLYRVDFSTVDSLSDLLPEDIGASKEDWAATRLSTVSAGQMRFMNKPVVGQVGGYVFVTFGSGDRERPLEADPPYDDSIQNYFFTVIDIPSDTTADVDLLGSDIYNLASGALSGDSLLGYNGWRMSLATRGEQIVNPSAIAGGKVYFNSFHPVSPGGASCGTLGTATGYSINLFTPEADTGAVIDGGGIPIPPIIATVDLDATTATCTGDDCGPGVIDESVVTVCIGCQGFEPIEVTPSPAVGIVPTYRVEDIDTQ